VKRRSLILIAGWGHAALALEPVASALCETCEVRVTSSHEIASRVNATRPGRPKPAKKEPGISSSYAQGLRSAIGGPDEKENLPVVIGWSAGGIVALEVACESPELLEGIVLIGATPRFCADEGYPWGMAARNVRAMIMEMKKNPRAVLDRFFQDVSWPAVEPESCRNEKIGAAHDMGIKHLVHGLKYLQKIDLRDRLKGVRIPALVIHGRDDRIVPWQAGAWLDHSLPDSRLIVHEGVGHDIPGQQPVALASEIREFLEARC
jgi:pimeloyl-ACP methyl ester carboxylesterase